MRSGAEWVVGPTAMTGPDDSNERTAPYGQEGASDVQQIERLRKGRGWSRYRLARELGVTEKAVAKWERGGIERAQYALMRRLARMFQVPMEDLDPGDG